MEEKILKKTAVVVLGAAVAICIAIPFLPQILNTARAWSLAMEDERTREEREKLQMSGVELLEYNNRQVSKDELPADGLALALPLGVTGADLKVTEDFLMQTVTVSIPYAGEKYLYEYPMLGNGEMLEGITFESGEKYGNLILKTDRVYELDTSYDETCFLIRFLPLQELYDKIIVIDAGHGGEDLGITKQGVHEKDINLDIVLKLKEIFDRAHDPAVRVYYTRTTDIGVDLGLRSRLAEKAGANLFVSVHNNATQSGMMSSIHGTQVVCDSKAQGAEELAQICLAELTAALGSSDKGIRAAVQGTDAVYGCRMPAVQIEAGFMTNQEELEGLCSQEYQEKAAQGIYNALMQALEKW